LPKLLDIISKFGTITCHLKSHMYSGFETIRNVKFQVIMKITVSRGMTRCCLVDIYRISENVLPSYSGQKSKTVIFVTGNALQDLHGGFICHKRRRSSWIRWGASSWSTEVRLTSRVKVKCIRTGCWVRPVSTSSYPPRHL
jgi:hypothetical protein